MTPLARGVISSGKLGVSATAFYNTLSPLSVGQHVTVANDSSWHLGDGNKSISFIFKCDSINTTIIASESVDSVDYLDIYVNANGHLNFRVLDSGGSITWIKKVETNFADSTFRSALCVFDGWGTGQVYIDGILQSTTDDKTGTMVDISPSTVLWVGASIGAATRFNGQLANFFIHNANLTQSNATELSTVKQPVAYSASITDNYALALPLNNGVELGREEEDFSGNENDGTLIGSPNYTGATLEYEVA